MRYLPREAAPFGERLWEQIDRTVIGAASSQLAGRRLLEVSAPLGLGVRAIGKLEKPVEGEGSFHGVTATLTSAQTLPLPLLRSQFALSIRDVAAAEEAGNPIDLAGVALAAIATARLEDALVFHGNSTLGVEGLMTAPGAASVGLGDWEQLGQPAEDLIEAATTLGAAGFPGPYAAALAPRLHDALYRVYEDSNLTQLEHARQIITGGIAKAPALRTGGVVVTVGSQFAHILLGQDMTAEFVGPSGADYEFVILEALVPRISVPQAICVLESE